MPDPECGLLSRSAFNSDDYCTGGLTSKALQFAHVAQSSAERVRLMLQLPQSARQRQP